MVNVAFYEKALKEQEAQLLSVFRDVTVRDKVTFRFNTQNNYDELEADFSDIATRDEEFENNSSLVENLSPALEEVEEALGRIEKGSYGFCLVCKKQIEEKRLKANVSAVTCITHMNG